MIIDQVGWGDVTMNNQLQVERDDFKTMIIDQLSGMILKWMIIDQ